MTDTETVNETGARDEGESPSIPESSLFPWLYKSRGSGLQKLIDRLRGRRHQAAHVEQKGSGRRFPTGRIVFSVVRLSIVLFVFLALVFMSVKLLQWAINGNDTVDNIQPYSFDDLFSHDYRDTLLRQASDPGRQNGRIILNEMMYGVVYFLLFAITNRFWLTTGLYSTLVIVFAIATRIKVALRDEPVLPADLTTAGGNAGEVGSFIPASYMPMIRSAVIAIVVIWLVCILFWWILGSCRLVWWDAHKAAWVPTRLVIALLPLLGMGFFVSSFGNAGSFSWRFAQDHGDVPILYDAVPDGIQNGPLVSFLRYVSPRVMEKPQGYSKEAMEEIARKYSQAATEINAGRQTNLSDSTVIFVLSESYSDPTRVPGISLNEDPMPFIRQVKGGTTSGLMLSSGYGGGTANLEFQALTGLSTANFSASLTSPYQQLVPRMKWAPSFNQIWNKAYGDASGVSSQAVHPYWGTLYLRHSNYKKFGFRHFYTTDGPEFVKHQDKIERNPHISDSSAYHEVLDLLRSKSGSAHPEFIQLATMQNHTGYENWYDNNQFQASSTTGQALSDAEKTHVQTYAKGVNYTDSAVKDFLTQLDGIDSPITVVWYGDHLPGIYDNEIKMAKNNIGMHEADYFIWSNAATKRAGNGTAAPQNQFTSPNYFMAQAATHMNAKVSPYLAFLTRMHQAIPAMEPTLSTTMDWSTTVVQESATYLDGNGERIRDAKLTKEQKRLLADYRMIQYDITAGKQYLEKLDFMTIRK